MLSDETGTAKKIAANLASVLERFGAYNDALTLVNKYGTTFTEVCGQQRMSHISMARHELMYFCWDRFKWSYPALGTLFNRDHTTVMAAVAKIKAKMKKEQAT